MRYKFDLLWIAGIQIRSGNIGGSNLGIVLSGSEKHYDW